MTTNSNAIAVTATDSEPLGRDSACSEELMQETLVPTDPGELEQEHSRLMQLQGQQASDEQLVEEARDFVYRVRQLGRRLEDPRSRQHWQGILTYWSIYAYRAARVDLDTELLAFDHSLSTSFSDDQYPYRFEDDSAKACQEMLAWRRLLDECERDLASDHLLTVVGDVGSGRKFLLFDLLLPMLRSGRTRRPELAGSENWRYVEVRLQNQPIRDLVQAIADLDGRDEHWVSVQENAIRAQPSHLATILESNAETRTLLAFERFGALLKMPADERAILIKALAGLLDDPGKRYFLAVTLRPRQTYTLSMFGELEHLLHDSHVLLAFTTAELRHLIEEPAQRIGLVFDHGLIDQIMNDIQGETTSLPLLQFTLARLWENRERNRITLKAYRKTKAGNNALRIAMDDIYDTLSRDQQSAFQAMVMAMVSSELNSGFVLCEVPQNDLYRICGDQRTVDELIDRLRRQKLLHERNVGGEHLVTLNNSALLRAWPPLVSWLDELQVRHRFRLRLKEAASQWQNHSHNNDLLWRGAFLVEADREFRSESTLTTSEQQFLEASRRRETLERRKRNLKRGTIIAIIAIAVIAFPYALWHHERQQRRSQNAVAALLSGDLTGALLWLNERQRHIDLPFLGRRAQDEKLRQFTQVQLPQLDTSSLAGKDSFGGTAVSDDGTHIATLSLLKPRKKNGESPRYVVKVTALPDGKFSDLQGPIRNEASGGCVAFVKHSSSSHPYLVVGCDQDLRCWLLNSATPEEIDWQKPNEHKDSQIVDLDASNGVLAITWLTSTGRRLVSLFNLTAGNERADQALQLEPIKTPDGLEGRDVRLLSLSSAGDLVAVLGPEMDQATILKAWRKLPGSSKWTLVSPPAWAIALDAKDSQRQRLYDYGWTLTQGETQERNWQRHGSFVRSLTFSPSGDTFATASDDGQVVLWSFSEANVTNVKQVAPKIETKLQLGSSVYDVTFLNDDVIATGGRDRTARIWNVHSGTEILPRMYHEGTVVRARFATRVNALITQTEQMWRMWRPWGSSEVVYGGSRYRVVADHQQITLSNLEHSDGSNGTAQYDIENIEKDVVSTVFSRSRDWVCTTYKAKDRSSFSLEARKSSEINQAIALERAITLHDFQAVPLVHFSPDDRWLVVADKAGLENATPRVYLWDLKLTPAGRRSANVPVLALTRSASSDLSGIIFRELAVGIHKNTGVLALVGEQKADSDIKEGVVCIGTFKTEKDDQTLTLRALKTPDQAKEAEQNIRAVSPHEQEVLCAGFSPSGDLLATGDARDYVKLWDVEQLIQLASEPTGEAILAKPTAKLKHSSDVKSLVFSPVAADVLATVSSEGEASIWSLADIRSSKGKNEEGETTTPAHNLRHEAKILCVSFSPSGEMIITGGLDRTARVWNIKSAARESQGTWASPELVGIFRHENPVTQVLMPKDDRVQTVSLPLTIADSEKENGYQVRTWDMSNSKAKSTSELRKLAARRVSGAELKKLEVSEFPADRTEP